MFVPALDAPADRLDELQALEVGEQPERVSPADEEHLGVLDSRTRVALRVDAEQRHAERCQAILHRRRVPVVVGEGERHEMDRPRAAEYVADRVESELEGPHAVDRRTAEEEEIERHVAHRPRYSLHGSRGVCAQ